MSEYFSAQFDALLKKKTTNKATSSSPFKMIIHKEEIIFFVTSCLTESGDTTWK